MLKEQIIIIEEELESIYIQNLSGILNDEEKVKVFNLDAQKIKIL